MSKYIFKRKGVSQGNSKTNRKAYFINSSNFSSQSPFSLSSEESDKGSSCMKLLRTKNNFLKRSKRRIKLVDQSKRQPQWKNYRRSKSRSGIDHRCITFRLGGGETCQGQSTGRVWSKEGGHKVKRLESPNEKNLGLVSGQKNSTNGRISARKSNIVAD